MNIINIKNITILVGIVAIICFAYIIYASKMPSYLSNDPKACINCHVMNTQYATWERSAHARVASCVDCHLPTDSFFDKYYAKSVDGWNHSVAFTLDTYDHSMKISDYAAERIQKNCISCHSSLASQMTQNASGYHNFDDNTVKNGRRCWDCHKSVPHGKVRGITTTPHNLGVKELK